MYKKMTPRVVSTDTASNIMVSVGMFWINVPSTKYTTRMSMTSEYV